MLLRINAEENFFALMSGTETERNTGVFAWGTSFLPREEGKQFIELLGCDLQHEYEGGFIDGYTLTDPRASIPMDRDNHPTNWTIITPNGDLPDSRIVIRDWGSKEERWWIDVILEGDCNTPERVTALKEFGFVEVTDEEPVLPPSEGTTSPEWATFGQGFYPWPFFLLQG